MAQYTFELTYKTDPGYTKLPKDLVGVFECLQYFI